jgi:hypothetical protein
VTPWRTLRSPEGIGAGLRFLLISICILAAYVVWTMVTFGSVVDSAAGILLAAGIVIFGVVRYSGERLEVHPWGLIVARLWSTRRIPWQDVAEVFIMVRQAGSPHADPEVIFIDGQSSNEVTEVLGILSNPSLTVSLVGFFGWDEHNPTASPVSSKEAARILVTGVAAAREAEHLKPY